LVPSALTVWAHIRYDHGTQPLAERLIELDDVYAIVESIGQTTDKIDADVLEEARRILQDGTGLTGTTQRWATLTARATALPQRDGSSRS
jgi:hypothetical protein